MKFITYIFIISISIFSIITFNVLGSNIVNCKNCKSDSSFGKIYNFDKKISNLKNDEFVVFWDGYLGTDELIITHKGIIKNLKLIQISDLNMNDLCVFGITDFPNLDGKYPNTILNESYAKNIKSRYFLWKNAFNRNSINEISKVCLGKRNVFLKNYPLETKYKCDLNNSSCKIIKFDGNKVQKANTKSPKSKLKLKGWTNSRICFFAVNDNKTDWTNNYQYIDHVEEAKSRGIDCGIISKQKQNIAKIKNFIPNKYFQSSLSWNSKVSLACYNPSNQSVYLIPFEGTKSRHKATRKCMGNDYRISMKDYKKLSPEQNVYENDKVICYKATDGWSGKWSESNTKYVNKAKSLGLSCGIAPEQKQIIVQENTKTAKIREKYLTFNNPVNQNWCAGTGGGSGYQPDSQPLPGADSFFDPCPGKYITKIPFEQVKQHFSSGEGNKFICSLLEDGSVLNKRLKVYFELAKEINLECKEETVPKTKIVIKEDIESKKLAEQTALELEEERARLKAMEIERKRLEEKTKQLAEQNRLAELKAKQKSEEIAKEVAAQERAKLAKEKALRLAEEKARKIAQEKAKKLAERERSQKR